MIHSDPEAQGRPQVPCEVINQAIRAAAEGEMPSFTTDEFLERVGLHGDTPDGLPLLERFRGGENSARTRLASHHLIGNMVALIQSANERQTNPAEEAIAKTLGVVVTRQLQREGDVCDGVALAAFAIEREDIISPEIQMAIAQAPAAAAAVRLRETLRTLTEPQVADRRQCNLFANC